MTDMLIETELDSEGNYTEAKKSLEQAISHFRQVLSLWDPNSGNRRKRAELKRTLEGNLDFMESRLDDYNNPEAMNMEADGEIDFDNWGNDGDSNSEEDSDEKEKIIGYIRVKFGDRVKKINKVAVSITNKKLLERALKGFELDAKKAGGFVLKMKGGKVIRAKMDSKFSLKKYSKDGGRIDKMRMILLKLDE